MRRSPCGTSGRSSPTTVRRASEGALRYPSPRQARRIWSARSCPTVLFDTTMTCKVVHCPRFWLTRPEPACIVWVMTTRTGFGKAPATLRRSLRLLPDLLARVAWAVHRATHSVTDSRLGPRGATADHPDLLRLRTSGRRTGPGATCHSGLRGGRFGPAPHRHERLGRSPLVARPARIHTHRMAMTNSA